MYHCHNHIVTIVQDNFLWKDLTASVPTVGKICLYIFLNCVVVLMIRGLQLLVF